MFIIKEKSDSTNKTVRLPNDLIEKLETLANSKNLSFSGIVNQIYFKTVSLHTKNLVH